MGLHIFLGIPCNLLFHMGCPSHFVKCEIAISRVLYPIIVEFLDPYQPVGLLLWVMGVVSSPLKQLDCLLLLFRIHCFVSNEPCPVYFFIAFKPLALKFWTQLLLFGLNPPNQEQSHG